MLSEVCRSIEAGVENLPAQVSAAVSGKLQKPVVVLLAQRMGRAVIAGKALRPFAACGGQAGGEQRLVQTGLQCERRIREQAQAEGQRPLLWHDYLVVFSVSVPFGDLVVQADQNGGIRPVQLKSSIPVEVFQEVQGILFCRLLLIQSVGQRTHGQHIADDREAAHADRGAAVQEAAPACDYLVCPCTVHRQHHRTQHMRIPVPADAPPHGWDRLHIEAGDRIAPGYLRIQGILRLPGDITGEECVQDCAVLL